MRGNAMKLYFKQRMFSWFDSYDVYYGDGSVAFTVEGKFAWGHRLHVLDKTGAHVGTVQQEFALMPRFALYEGGRYRGCIRRKFHFIQKEYSFDCNGWKVFGDWLEWDYHIVDERGILIAHVEKEIFRMTDTYVIDVVREEDALLSLMFVIALDAEKCSRN